VDINDGRPEFGDGYFLWLISVTLLLMHQHLIHALGSPKVYRRIANGFPPRYASTSSTTQFDKALPAPSNRGEVKRRSNSPSRKQLENRKTQSTSTEPSENAKELPKEKSALPKRRSHSVWKAASVWVPRSPRRPEERPEGVLHPLLCQDIKLPGEWQPTPPKGPDFTPLKRLLLQNRTSADPAIQAMAESKEDILTTVAGDSDWVEMSFAPGTFVETRRQVFPSFD
jgi:hypothetical protein